ncbi:phenylpyruvate tautomerase MIF-related protein [Desulfocurvus sp. DL9XJH121]
MPFIKVKTNVALDEGRRNGILEGLTALASELTGKPAQWVMACVEDGAALAFAGTREPAAYVEFKSIGLAENVCADQSAGICEFVERELGVPQARVYIEFKNLERCLFGWNGATF